MSAKKPEAKPKVGASKAPVIPTAADLEAATGGTSMAAIKEITALARRQMLVEDQIAELEQQVAMKKALLLRLATTDLPNAMKVAKVASIKLDSGDTISVQNFVTGNIKEANKPKAFAWLRKHGFGSLIKTTIDLAFGMGEEKKAEQVATMLAKKKIPFEMEEGVHASTLRAFVRERLSAGKALPPTIDVASVPTATIKRNKE